MLDYGKFELMQKDGTQATVLASSGAPGESGVSVFGLRFAGGGYYSSQADHHLVFLMTSESARVRCDIAGKKLEREATFGSIAICPANADCAAEAAASLDSLVVAVDPGTLSLAAADDKRLELRVMDRLSGQDPAMLALAQVLSAESRAGYPNGPLFWHETARRFIDGILERHTMEIERRVRGALGNEALAKLREFIMAHLSDPIDVPALASIAGRSPFHFSRVFTQSVGISPHRYVVHLRLQRAVELIGTRSGSFAEIAALTGFADQSHLSRWVRRVHGVSLRQLAS